MPEPLRPLTDQLAELGRLLQQTNEQVVAYLVEREAKGQSAGTAPADTGPLAEQIDAVAQGLKQLEERVDQKFDEVIRHLGSPRPAPEAPPESNNIAETSEIEQGPEILEMPIISEIREARAPAQTGPVFGVDWQRALLGPELAEHPGLEPQRDRLIDALLAGDANACALIGELLVFRSSPTDKLPPLLKDIGEAYYRWQPKVGPVADPMEGALVEWLVETMQDAGMGNRIEVVHPGERFDSTRHTATGRGVEITEVHGWMVLRDNGRVYTKANVTVK